MRFGVSTNWVSATLNCVIDFGFYESRAEAQKAAILTKSLYSREFGSVILLATGDEIPVDNKRVIFYRASTAGMIEHDFDLAGSIDWLLLNGRSFGLASAPHVIQIC